MKKSLFCIATALMLTGCAEFLPSDDVLEVAPQSFQEYLLRQEDELQEGLLLNFQIMNMMQIILLRNLQ